MIIRDGFGMHITSRTTFNTDLIAGDKILGFLIPFQNDTVANAFCTAFDCLIDITDTAAFTGMQCQLHVLTVYEKLVSLR